MADERAAVPGDWKDRYRDAWRWERVASVTHCVVCYPEACPFKAYIVGDKVVREEQSGLFDMVEQDARRARARALPAGPGRRTGGRPLAPGLLGRSTGDRGGRDPGRSPGGGAGFRCVRSDPCSSPSPPPA